jgi:hypothetical protein
MSQNDKYIKDKKFTNFLESGRLYSRDLWEQSSDPLQYIVQLDRETQNAINLYYAFSIPMANKTSANIESMVKDRFTSCFMEMGIQSEKEIEECKTNYNLFLEFEKLPADWVSKASLDLLKKFHPTKDRLNNYFLRAVMGSDSVRPLADK